MFTVSVTLFKKSVMSNPSPVVKSTYTHLLEHETLNIRQNLSHSMNFTKKFINDHFDSSFDLVLFQVSRMVNCFCKAWFPFNRCSLYSRQDLWKLGSATPATLWKQMDLFAGDPQRPWRPSRWDRWSSISATLSDARSSAVKEIFKWNIHQWPTSTVSDCQRMPSDEMETDSR